MFSDIHVTKVKETETGGRPTPQDQPISMRMQPSNTQFTIAGKDVISSNKFSTKLKF